MWGDLQAKVADVLRITPQGGLPNTLTVAVGGIGADVLVAALDLAGYSVSTGSACAAGAPEPSHVALGLGIGPRYVRGVIRISMGWDTEESDVSGLVQAFADAVERARKAA
jgi:cysteine desulfurase